MIGALAQSLGVAAEAAVVWVVLRSALRADEAIPRPLPVADRKPNESSESL
ncbi:hypothetical protein SAMN04487970_101860 [Paenibacillus tianmuensis]|uniref:Uncharacterized protein n=1 Tax=Paenibacillus tianmuensis TaxID=624147 RepID=A0A1G4RR88_9BACL|nr:hypothetical protein [Paenibacillus tianmuensis]SCW59316.1 hypothetical protein SAMN04487970_101860 [Paenibacillus tianmuensis]